MTTRDYEQLIVESIKGLSAQTLAEIADFVQFLKERSRAGGGLHVRLGELSRDEEAHLE